MRESPQRRLFRQTKRKTSSRIKRRSRQHTLRVRVRSRMMKTNSRRSLSKRRSSTTVLTLKSWTMSLRKLLQRKSIRTKVRDWFSRPILWSQWKSSIKYWVQIRSMKSLTKRVRILFISSIWLSSSLRSILRTKCSKRKTLESSLRIIKSLTTLRKYYKRNKRNTRLSKRPERKWTQKRNRMVNKKKRLTM